MMNINCHRNVNVHPVKKNIKIPTDKIVYHVMKINVKPAHPASAYLILLLIVPLVNLLNIQTVPNNVKHVPKVSTPILIKLHPVPPAPKVINVQTEPNLLVNPVIGLIPIQKNVKINAPKVIIVQTVLKLHVPTVLGLIKEEAHLHPVKKIIVPKEVYVLKIP